MNEPEPADLPDPDDIPQFSGARKLDALLVERLVQHVHQKNYQPVKPKVILKELGLREEDYRKVRITIKRLVQQGLLSYSANHLVLPVSKSPKSPKSQTAKSLTGTFRQAAGGFGFARPVLASEQAPAEDIFIPPPCVGSALDGDLVEVRIRKGKGRSAGGIEGEIVSVVERSRRQFSGTFQVIEGQPCVWLDGVQATQPVAVGDVRGLPLEANDKVVVELVRFPEAGAQGEGVILEVLGSSKNPAVDTLAVMRQFGLMEEFPAEVIEQARKTADEHKEEIPSNRRDLTAIPTLTIDPRDARDFDDAISLSKNEAGHWVLLVHIADVAYFVPSGSVLDLEARRRGTSVYLPDRVIPMLPELISNHLASLQPNKNRFTKTVEIHYTPTGVVTHTEVYNSVIHNAQRLTYEQVDQFLADREGWKSRLSAPIHQLLGDMHELAMILRKRRNQQGSIELTLPEIKIELDKSGKVRGAHLEIYTESHQMIEEFMLAANQAVATWLDDLKLPFLRRAHPSPERRRLTRLTEFVRDLGIRCENLEDRFQIQEVVRQVRGKSTEYAVNYAILKSMAKAVYQPQPERHYALDMTHYCHFTSPIRRYPDLTIHRIVQKLIDGEPAAEPMPVLIRMGQQCSDQEQNAEQAERELIKVKLLHYLSKLVGQSMPGVITSVNQEGFFVRGTQMPAEGFVPVHALPPDRYYFERRGHLLTGYRSGNSYRLGDEVVVKVDHVDLARRQLLFQLESSRASKRDSTQEIGRPRRSTSKGEGSSGRHSKSPGRFKRDTSRGSKKSSKKRKR